MLALLRCICNILICEPANYNENLVFPIRPSVVMSGLLLFDYVVIELLLSYCGAILDCVKCRYISGQIGVWALESFKILIPSWDDITG